MASTAHSARVVDFSCKDELARWSAADDVVMGGVSSSCLIATPDGTALFTGDVSLACGGGFASVRSTAGPRRLVGARALVLRACGDGKRYQLRLRTTSTHDGVSYLASFETEPDTWHELAFTPSDFMPTWRGRTVPDAPALAMGDVQSFGFLIADQQAGSFELEVAWIASL